VFILTNVRRGQMRAQGCVFGKLFGR